MLLTPSTQIRSTLARKTVQCCAVLVLALSLASSATAERPSLLGLQAAIDGLVSPPATTPVYEIVFDGTDPSLFDLIDLTVFMQATIGCNPSCHVDGVNFLDVRATIVQSAQVAVLTANLIAGQPQTVTVALPKSQSLLTFRGALLLDISNAETPEQMTVAFTYSSVTYEVAGTFASHDILTNITSGCTIPNGELYLDLAGNASANLGPDEIESSHQLLISSQNRPLALAYKRTPTNACTFSSLLLGQPLRTRFDRLWTSNDAFPAGRQVVETIEVDNWFIEQWNLSIEGSVLSEEMGIIPGGGPLKGSLTVREFSPLDGDETASETAGL